MNRFGILGAVFVLFLCSTDASVGAREAKGSLPEEVPPLVAASGPGSAAAVLIGLTNYDANEYAGDNGSCPCCVNDALQFRDAASARGFSTRTLKDKDATAGNILKSIAAAASRLKKGDTFLLMFSGHGGRLYDRTDTEPSGYDSTLCAYDREILDNEIFAALTKFKEGVRVLVVADSCHSGTIIYLRAGAARATSAQQDAIENKSRGRYKYLPHDIAVRTYEAHQSMYDAIRKATPHLSPKDVKASIVLLAAADDEGVAQQGSPLSPFTAALLRVAEDRSTSVQDAFRLVEASLKPTQKPNYCAIKPRDCVLEVRPLFGTGEVECTPAALLFQDCRIVK